MYFPLRRRHFPHRTHKPVGAVGEDQKDFKEEPVADQRDVAHDLSQVVDA
jgi:hypothetical protein